MRPSERLARLGLGQAVPWVELGDWPTPVVRVAAGGRETWWKCEGDSHAAYGGNKVRTLEAWLGHAKAIGAPRIWAIGAYGSNHTLATVVHAPRAGLRVGAIVFPQPASEWAEENCAALIAASTRAAPSGSRWGSETAPRSESASSSDVTVHEPIELVKLRSVIEVPFAAARIARAHRGDAIMPPGGATPVGTFGAMLGAFELAEQIARGELPAPARIVVAAGSTCTAAGLLAGTALAHATGDLRAAPPAIHIVRVTPWPITSRAQIVHLAHRTLARVAALGGPAPAITRRALSARLAIDGRELGPGYGVPTPTTHHALATFARAGAPRLDGVYSAKAAAAMLRLPSCEPVVFWASKSSALAHGDRAAARAWFASRS